MTDNLFTKLYGDKGYIRKALAETLFDKGVKLITNVHKNMQARLLSLWDSAILKKRFLIETINDQLKHISQIEHSRHRSIHGFMLSLIGGLMVYCLKDNKPFITLSTINMAALQGLALPCS